MVEVQDIKHGFPKKQTILLGLGIVAALSLGASIGHIVYDTFGNASHQAPRNASWHWRLAFAYLLSLALLARALPKLAENTEIDLGLRFPKMHEIGYAVTGAVLIFIWSAIWQRLYRTIFHASPHSHWPHFFVGFNAVDMAVAVATLICITPITEEMIFRGFLLNACSSFMPRATAVVCSAAVFAAYHLSAALFPQHFVTGIALAYLYVKTKSIGTSMIAHSLVNGCSTLLLIARH